MLYLSKFLNSSVFDKEGELVGKVDDLAVNAKEVFPSIVALSLRADDGTERIFRWADNVDSFDLTSTDDESGKISLKTKLDDLDYTQLEDNELFLGRGLLDKQIVDVKEKKVARVSDLKLSADEAALRLLGAECSLYGRLHFATGFKASCTRTWASVTGKGNAEDLIAWNYIDIPEGDMSRLELSITHERLKQLRPAEIAGIIEQLDPKTRAAIFAQLDKNDAADTTADSMSELEDSYQVELIEKLGEEKAVDLLAKMKPDDATNILSGLDYDKAEKILQLMGIEDAEVIRTLMEYRNNSAGGIMTPTVAVATEEMTVKETTDYLRQFVADTDDLHYVYIVDGGGEEGAPIANSRLLGVVTLLELLLQDDDKKLGEIAHYNVISTSPDEDQEVAAELIAKHNLLALPVIDKDGYLLGAIAVDDVADIRAAVEESSLVSADGKETPTLINSGTVGDEVKGIFCKIGSGLRWILPQNLNWVMIWLATLLFVYLGQMNVFSHMMALEWDVPTSIHVLSLNLEVVQVSLFVIPLVLVTIVSGVLRSTELLTGKAQLAPSTFVRYCGAIIIAIAHTFIAYSIIILSIAAMSNAETLGELLSNFGQSFSNLTLLIFIPMLCALLISTLFAAWRVGVAASKHKTGGTINPGRIATAAMLIFILFFTSLVYPAGWVWYEQTMRAQEEMMMDGEWDDWGDEYWGEGDWNGEWEGEDFGEWDEGNWDDYDWDGEVIDLGDIEWDGGELDLEELLSEELGELGEIELE